MEFKGTKGNWYVLEYGGFVNIQDGAFYEDNSLLDFEEIGEREAMFNGLLMSKSPEMLEMLQDISTYKCDECIDSGLLDRVKELIKKATEL